MLPHICRFVFVDVRTNRTNLFFLEKNRSRPVSKHTHKLQEADLAFTTLILLEHHL